MKAVRIYQFGGPEVLTHEEVEIPTPGAGEVLIKVAVAGVNFAEIGQRIGVHHFRKPEFPMTLGNEVAGTVQAVGSGVTGLAIGTRVAAPVDAGYAEYAIAAASLTLPIPDAVSFEQAVVVPVQGQTVHLLLNHVGRLQQGEGVLVHAAAGGVGSLAVQVARLLGAGMVIGTTTSPEKAAFIQGLDADAVIDTTAENWVGQVMQATRGQGVNIVLDSVGNGVGQQSIFCLAPFGRLISFGALSGQPTPFVSQMLIEKCLSVIGFNTPAQPLPERLRASEFLFQAIAAGRLKVDSEHAFALAGAADAHRALEQKQTRGKVILKI